MKLLFLLFAGLFNQDNFLVKQADVIVQLSELDAYVFSMSDYERVKFSENKQHIENSVITLLNINIVFQYITNSELADLDVFKQINNQDFSVETNNITKFSDALGLSSEQVSESFNKYKIENEYYRTLLVYLNQQADGKLVPLAKEHYLINKKNYVIAEKRDLSVIVLNNEMGKRVSQVSILNELKDKTEEYFHQKALELSIDSSKDLNKGRWGEFRKSDFSYSFKDSVFSANVGVIPQLFEQGDKTYIVRVNDIEPQLVQTFEEVSDRIIHNLKGKTVAKEFQSIINQKGSHKIEVNPELIAHIFERYKVFTEE